jgi:tRNA uridine 5-carbamoylmethylation protein Kti12
MIVVKFDPNTNQVTSLSPTGDAKPDETTLVFHDQNTKSDVLNDLFVLAKTVPLKYMIVEKGVPREMTQVEKDAVDAAIAAVQKQAEIDRIQSLAISPIEVVKGLVRLNIIPDEQAFIDEIKKYRMVIPDK